MSQLENFVANSGTDDRTARSIATAKVVLQTSQNPPDQAGKDIRLGRQYGVPPGAVALDRPHYQNRATVDASSAALARSPKLADWIASQPVKAEAAQDDVPGLGMVENALTSLKSFAQKAPKRLFNEGWLRLRQQVAATNATVGSTYGLFPESEAARGWQERRRQLQNQADTVARENRGDGFVSEAILQGLSSLPANVPSLLFGGFAARGAGAATQATLSAIPMGTLVASDAYQRGLDEGLDNPTALRFGLTQGTAETVFEFLPALDLFKNIAIGTPLVRTVLNNVFEEAGAEAATQLVQSFDEKVTLDPEKTFGEWLREVPSEMLAAAIGGATGAGITSPVVYGLDRVAARFDGRDAAVRQAEDGRKLLGDMLKLSEASKLRERDPATFAEFVQMAAEDGPADTVFVDANALVETLAQSGIEVDQLQEALPSIASQLNEAAATGRDVAIPVGEFLAQPEIANKLLDQVKVTPAGMTKAEAERFMAERGDELQREVEAAVTQATKDEELRTGYEAVKAQFKQQFGEVNRFRADVNDSYASLMAAFFTTMAQRANTTPEALLQRFNLRVQAERPTGSAVLDQPTESGYGSANGQDPQRPGDRADRAGEGTPAGDPTEAGRLPGSDQLRGGNGSLANEPGAEPGLSGLPAQDALLPGSPAELELPGFGRIAVTAHAPARQAAADYMASRGLYYGPPNRYAAVDRARAERIAAEFDALPIYPETPEAEAETLAAYEAMIEETVAQWRAIEATGLQIEWITEETGDPYEASPRLAILDVQNNNRLFVYPTSAGFGTQNEASEKNPLLRWADFEIGGRRVQMNDVFRIVHDYFGHIKDGHGFRATGEENAWQSHAAMYTPLARRAMTIETRGQNSWLNYGPFGERNRNASSADTIYADQKIGLLPEWASEEGMLAHPWSGQAREEVNGGRLAQGVSGGRGDADPPAAADAVGWTPERIDRLIEAYAPRQEGKTRAFAVMMSPDQFLGLTASERGRQAIAEETGPLDPDRLRNEGQTPFLFIKEPGEPSNVQRQMGITSLPTNVMAHEGRHRMSALKAAGYTRVPVLLIVERDGGGAPVLPENVALGPQRSRLQPELTNGDTRADVSGFVGILPENRDALLAMGQDAGLLFQGQWQPPFYSSLQKAAREAKQDKGTVDQWKAALSRAPGVKKEELEWTGVLDWLDVLQAEHTGNGQLLITRQQVMDFLDANGIVVEEIVKSANPEWDDNGGGMSDARRDEIEREAMEDAFESWQRNWDAVYIAIAAWDHDHVKARLLDEIDRRVDEEEITEEEAEAAREKLNGQFGDEIDYETIDIFTGAPWPRPTPLTGFWVQLDRDADHDILPDEWTSPEGTRIEQVSESEYMIGPFPDFESAAEYRNTMKRHAYETYRDNNPEYEREYIDRAIEQEENYGDRTGGPKWGEYITNGGQGEDYTEVLFRLPLGEGANPKKTTGTHWDEEGVVAHARFDTRTGANGERVMAIHEIQSDWHQKGAKQGYNVELKPAERAALEAQERELREKRQTLWESEEYRAWDRRKEELREALRAAEHTRGVVMQSIRDFIAERANTPWFGESDIRALIKNRGLPADQHVAHRLYPLVEMRAYVESLSDEEKQKVGDVALTEVAKGLNADDRAELYRRAEEWVDKDATARNAEMALAQHTPTEPHRNELLRISDAIQSIDTKLSGTGGIPDAPFKNLGYAQLAVKRLLRWAVEHDYDQVIWINGDQQNGWDSGDAGSWFYGRVLINLVNEQLKAFRNKPDAEDAADLEPVDAPIDTADYDRRIADAEKTLIERGLEPSLEAALRWTTLNEIDGRAFRAARDDLAALNGLKSRMGDGETLPADLAEEERAQRKAAAEQIVAVGDAYSFLREKHADKNFYVAGIEKERADRIEQRRMAEAALAEARDEIAAIEKDIADVLASVEGREELVKAWIKEKKASARENRAVAFENLPIPDDLRERLTPTIAAVYPEATEKQIELQLISAIYETGRVRALDDQSVLVFGESGAAVDGSLADRYTALQTDLEEAKLRLTAIQNTVNGKAASAGRVRWIVGVKGMEKDGASTYEPDARERRRAVIMEQIGRYQRSFAAAEAAGDAADMDLWGAELARVQDQLTELDAPPRGHMGFDITQAMRDAAMGGFPLFSQQNRGAYSPSQSTITLLRAADLSTFLHEAGHFFLDVMEELAADPNATAEVKSDFDRIMRWFGTDAKTWSRMTLDQRRENHEKWARGFEAYLFTGQAPAVNMTGLFQRFRSWLKAVYKSVANLDVNLSPDIRGVMDRMLAAEGEIAEAEAARSMTPLFADPAASGMSAEEWREYQLQAQAATDVAEDELGARAMRDMQWLRNARGREIAKLQREAREKRAAVRREVTAEVDAIPAYRAEKFLRRGILGGQKVEGGFKLSIEEIEALYADRPMLYTNEIKARLAGMVGRANAIHPEQAAEVLGFSSADELIQALAAAEPRNELIEAETEKRMLERYGELSDPQAIEEAADRAVSNQARARFVATELNALSRTVGRPKLLATAAKQFAAQTIARLRIRDIRPASYEAAERRAAQAAMKALAQGNRTAAAAEKRNQLINLYAARAAHEAREEMQKALAYFKKFQKAGVEKRVDPDYLDQINGLLETFDLAPSLTNRETDRRKGLLEWVEEQRAKGLEPIIDPALLLAAGRKSWRDMTVEEMRGLRDAVASIEHLGRLKNRLLTARRERDFKAAVEKARLAIQANAFKTNRDQIESNTWLDGVRAGLSDWFAQHRKIASIFRTMDGQQDGGILWELFVRPMNEAGDREAVMREEATVRLMPVFKAISKRGGLRSKVYIPAIGTSLSYEGRLAVALNYGNELNRQRLYDGDKWTDEQVRAVLGTLTAEDFQIVQTIWREIARYWPMIQEKERRVTGLTPEPAEPSPFVVETADGQTVALDGGYYPIKYDPRRSGKAESDTLAEEIKQQLAGAYTRATTRRGHTKARVDTVERPVRKDLGVITDHIGQVIHDLSWHEWLIDANRLLGALDSTIREHYDPETARALSQGLRDIAVGDVPPVNSIEKTVNHLRAGATIVGMGWSLMTAMMQPFGFTQSVVRIGPQWVGKGLAKIAGDALHLENSAKWVHERSEFMRLRAKTMQREINELRNQVSATPAMWQTVQASFFVLIAKTQLMVDLPTWLGAYEKAMASGQDEPTAAALADQAVIDSQGGGQIKDLAAVQRGGVWLKLWTNFYSYFNVTYNLMAESVAETRRVGPKRLPLLAVDFLLLTILPATLAELLRQAVSGGEDDDEEFTAKMLRANLSYLMGMMIGLREVGQVIGFDGGYGGPAGARFLQELSKLRKQAEQGEADEAFWKALNTAGGILFHYPAGQINRTVSGIDALIEGRTDRIGAVFTGPNAAERAA